MIKNPLVVLAACVAAVAACQPEQRYPGAFQGVIDAWRAKGDLSGLKIE